MKKIQMITELKQADNKWHLNCVHENMTTEEIYKRLADAVIAKKVCGCRYIKSIKRRNNYDGTCEITITYDNRVRNIYTVPCN